ncbi:MAG: M23 family metallopeptidase [Bifidobacteriaceae bacterium]|jgi:murein DD-endopeptidase MepM/ murein hydrolase activator NlpD|nr:M23 family metallopeptidase [Bifidobacteriaceae bacterium]
MLNKTVAVLAAAALMAGPAVVMLGVGLLVAPAQADCLTRGGLGIVGIPDSLDAVHADGAKVTLNRPQLTHAATIITAGARIEGVTRDGIAIALMAALTESRLRMLANTGAYPESADYPNDGDASDHDSLGLFQMRPAAGWGTVEELMDPDYQARAFYGGPAGPNHPSPRGLLDIPGWQTMPKGEAAQAVEVSAYPDRYQGWEPVAQAILAALTGGAGGGTGSPGVPQAGAVVVPLPDGTWTRSSPYGWRTHPITGTRRLHAGVDLSAPDGTPIMAAAAGLVAYSGPSSGYGNLILIEHDMGGEKVFTGYAHMWDGHLHVQAGDQVVAGQHIADVGSNGWSTGPHLHFEVRPGGPWSPAIDPEPWLASHGAEGLPGPGTSPEGCAMSAGDRTPPKPQAGMAPAASGHARAARQKESS